MLGRFQLIAIAAQGPCTKAPVQPLTQLNSLSPRWNHPIQFNSNRAMNSFFSIIPQQSDNNLKFYVFKDTTCFEYKLNDGYIKVFITGLDFLYKFFVIYNFLSAFPLPLPISSHELRLISCRWMLFEGTESVLSIKLWPCFPYAAI